MPVAHKLIDGMAERNPEILQRCEYFSGDRGYDDTKLHKKLWDEHQIKPIIDIRRSWRDGEETRRPCPAEHYGMKCRDKEFCKIPKQVRIPLSEDRRIFSPVARSSYKWMKLYNDRTAVERVNSRIDKMFGFDNHTIQGLDKMSFRITFAFIMMLSFAVGKAAQNKESEIRRFLSA